MTNSPIDELVRKLLDRIEEKAPSTIDSSLIERLISKVDDHDKTLMLMAKTMEDINKILSDFANITKEIQSDQIQHWKNQDKLMLQNEAILKQLADGTDRFRQIEKKQNETGCSSLMRSVDARKEHDNLTDIKISHLEKRLEETEEEIRLAKEQPKKRMETVVTEVIKYMVVFTIGAVLLKFGIGGK